MITNEWVFDYLGSPMKNCERKSHKQVEVRCALEDVVLQYTYPRLDSEVTKHRNHLLKAPFCIHPSTGRVCVPVDPRKVDEFDPENVPTVAGLLKELDEATTMDAEHHSGIASPVALSTY
jgi:DNA primase small subunit